MTDATVLNDNDPVDRPSTAGSPLFQLTAIILAGGSASFAFVSLGPLQEAMRIALGLSDTQIALIQGPALYLTPMLVGLPLGFLIDRFSRARLLMIFTALEVVGTVLTVLAPNFASIVVGRMLVGSMQTANAINASALVVEWVGPQQRGRALMILGVVQMACVSSAFPLGGELLMLLGNWRSALLGLAAPLGLVFLLSLGVREPPRRGTPRARLEWRPAVGKLLHYWGVLADLTQKTGGPRRTITLLIVLGLLLVPTGCYGVMPSVPLFCVMLGSLCLIGGMKGIICTALASVVIPGELLGLSLGAVNAIAAVFSSLAPVAVSMLADRIGSTGGIGQALTIVCIVTSLVGVGIFVQGRRYFSGDPG